MLPMNVEKAIGIKESEAGNLIRAHNICLIDYERMEKYISISTLQWVYKTTSNNNNGNNM